MADFPEKENLDTENELSTVFSDPATHREIKVKPKKLLPKIIAGALALCLLIGGTVAVIKLIPVLEDDGSSSVGVEEIKVKELSSNKISKITVTNSQGSMELYSKSVKNENSSSGGETLKWYLSQVDTSLTDSTAIENKVNAMSSISATRKITEKTAEECGFNNPSFKATVTPTEGEAYTILLGAESPDNTGYYLKLENEDIIYLVGDSVYEALQFSAIDFASTAAISGFTSEDSSVNKYFSEGTLSYFDRLTIKGSNFPKPLEICYNDDEEMSKYISYLVTSPQKRLAQNVDGIFALYSGGIEVSGAYSYDTSASALKRFGLDNPNIITTMYLGNKSLTFKLALQEDGDYAVISDNSRLIHRVAASTLTGVADLSTTDYYLTSVFMISIEDISNFTVNTPDNSYSFDVSKIETEDEDDEVEYDVKIGDKQLKGDNFQNFYMECLSLSTQDFTEDSLSGKPQYSLVATLKTGEKTNIEFTKVTATRYQCVIDGVQTGRVTASSLSNIGKLAEKLANGETIE